MARLAPIYMHTPLLDRSRMGGSDRTPVDARTIPRPPLLSREVSLADLVWSLRWKRAATGGETLFWRGMRRTFVLACARALAEAADE